jgi:hypothetical protein
MTKSYFSKGSLMTKFTLIVYGTSKGCRGAQKHEATNNIVGVN